MNDSILNSIKKLLGISDFDTSFDQDLLMHINSVFVILYQIGVGPSVPFRITSDAQTWQDFTDDMSKLEFLKSYIALRVQQLFDPSSSNQVLESQKNLISELEWRAYVEEDKDSNE